MPSDLIYREDAKDFVRHAYNKGLNPIEYLDEVPAADVRPVVRGSGQGWITNHADTTIFVLSADARVMGVGTSVTTAALICVKWSKSTSLRRKNNDAENHDGKAITREIKRRAGKGL